MKAKAAAILAVESKDFWAGVTVPKLEEIRVELRGIMKYQAQVPTGRLLPRVFDVTDATSKASTTPPSSRGSSSSSTGTASRRSSGSTSRTTRRSSASARASPCPKKSSKL